MYKRKNVMGSGTTKRSWQNVENNLLTSVCYVGKTYHMDYLFFLPKGLLTATANPEGHVF